MEDIFAPLGMQDSYFYLPVAKAKRLVTLYGDFKGQGLVVLEASDTGLIKENPRYPVEGAHSYFPGAVGLSCCSMTALSRALGCSAASLLN